MSANQTVTVNLTCNGSGGSTAKTATLHINWLNDTPTISNITNKTINEDSNTGNIAFTVSDEETAAGSLTVTATSSNTALVPNNSSNLTLGNSGGSRTIKVTPAANQYGTATITVSVSDDVNPPVSDSFVVTVNSVNDAPTITNITDRTINEDSNTGNITFTVGDVETLADSLMVTATSSNTTLVPNNSSNLILGGSGGSRTIKVTPATNQYGTATITVSVSDGANPPVSDSFVVTVTNQPDLNLPATSNTSTFTVTFGGLATYSELQENVSGNWETVWGASGGDLESTELTRADGTYTFRLQDCQVTPNPPAGPVTTCTTILTKSIVVDAPAPAVTINFNPASISEGGSATFSWNAIGATSCSGTGLSGVSGASGSVNYNAPTSMSADQAVTVNLACDGNGGSITKTATLNVSWVNDAPIISNITDKAINEDNDTGTISFTVSDEETVADSLTVTATSSNTTLVPNSNLELGGTGGSRTIKVTPIANQYGTATNHGQEPRGGTKGSDSLIFV